MGCDIHCYAEQQDSDQSWIPILGCEPFDCRHYGWFAFLADVRNYSGIEPISAPRGMPSDISRAVAVEFLGWGDDAHSASWLSLDELEAFDYDAPCEDRRVTRTLPSGIVSGGCTCEAGEGIKTTYREYLGPAFFAELANLREYGAKRIVFWFDN